MKISNIAVFALLAWSLLAGLARAESEPNVFESSDPAPAPGPLDKLVLRQLAELDIRPVLCSDAVFVRRAFLDVIGTLPTAREARDFIEDEDPDKRRLLIESLLERPEFADYWAMKWDDLLRVKAEFPVNLWPNATQAYHHWIRTAIRDNLPYDVFVRELLTANGSNFRVGPVNFYRALPNRTPEGIATTVALTFMGARAGSWPTNSLAGLAVFFSQLSYKPTREWKEEIVFWNPDQADFAKCAAAASNQVVEAAAPPPAAAVFPDGTRLENLPPDKDPRAIFADWLITPENPWFATCLVNRIWAWLLGRGIIQEPDDIRPDNPPSNPELLDYLRKEFIASHYNLKHIYRLVLTSQTYQFSPVNPDPGNEQAEACFASYPLRRLDAEVLIDAINRITGASDLYTSPIPEPFTFIPENKPAIALPDGSITSPFLDLFGRPARATGMVNERVNKLLPTQRLHLLNSSNVQRKIEDSARLKALMTSSRKPREITEALYLTILSRYPTEPEIKNAADYAKSGVVKGREAWIDLVWALLNSDEFLYRH